MKNLKLIAGLVFIVALAASCSKYDEGSNFSLLTAKNRITNTWTLNKLEINGQTQGSASAQFTIDIRKDNSFTRTVTFFGTVSDGGTWSFSGNKTNLVLSYADGTVSTYKIIQLKSKSLKVEETLNGDTYRFSFNGN